MNPHRASGLESLVQPAYNLAMRFPRIDSNPVVNGLRFTACLVLALTTQASTAAVGNDASPQTLQIFQQRTSDGRVVLTDRPVAGAVTQRTWTAPVEDPQVGLQRREQARVEALAVSDRIQRRIDAEADRDQELTLARMRVAGEQAKRDAEIARAAAQDNPGIFYGPGYFTGYGQRPIHRPPRHPRPGTPRGHQPPLGMLGAPR